MAKTAGWRASGIALPSTSTGKSGHSAAELRHRTHQLSDFAVPARGTGHGVGTAVWVWRAGLPVRRAADEPAGLHAAVLRSAAQRQKVPSGVLGRDAAAHVAVHGGFVKLRCCVVGVLLSDAGAADLPGMGRPHRRCLHGRLRVCQRHQALHQPAVGGAAAGGRAQERVESQTQPRVVHRGHAGGRTAADPNCGAIWHAAAS